MAQATTRLMPKSVHSDIETSAVAEALLMHYNVGISNPWFELGLSEQETYNRRRLPWAGNDYTVPDGASDASDIQGPNVGRIPDSLKERWVELASESRDTLKGNVYGDLEELYHEGLTEVGSALSEDRVEITTESGDTVQRLRSELSEAQMQEQNINGA